MKPVKKHTPTEALGKLMKYCAYQERCHDEVRGKLLSLGVYGTELEEIISKLIQANFLNEERYAKAFVGGKFRQNQWGRVKIILELKQRHISDYCIAEGLKEISSSDYQKLIEKVISKKMRETKEVNHIRRNMKVAKYLIGRGFEPELVWQEIKQIAD